MCHKHWLLTESEWVTDCRVEKKSKERNRAATINGSHFKVYINWSRHNRSNRSLFGRLSFLCCAQVWGIQILCISCVGGMDRYIVIFSLIERRNDHHLTKSDRARINKKWRWQSWANTICCDNWVILLIKAPRDELWVLSAYNWIVKCRSCCV